MSKWTRVTLEQIANISAGQNAPQGKNNYSDYGTPFIKAGNLEFLTNGGSEDEIQKVNDSVAKSHNLKLFCPGTIVFAKSGMSCMKGYVYVLKNSCYVVNHLACVTPININSNYLRFYFMFQKPNKLVKDEAYPSISLTDISSLEIPLPPMETQKQIAKTLDTVSELLAMRKQQLIELDNLIKSVFYDMFGDPLINDKGWNLVTLGEIGTFKNGMNYSIIDSGFNMRCLGVGDFKDLYYIKDMSKLSFIGFSEPPSQEYLLKNGDIVFVRSNGNKDLIGRSIEIFPGEEKVTFSGFCIRYRITNACLNSCYLNHVLHVPSLRKKLLKDGRGCNIQNLNQQMLSALLVPVPPIEHQNRFVSIVNKIEDQKSLVKKSIEETQLLFDSLMSQYFDE